MNQNHNPLRQFFRQPAIYLRLPSEGKYWPEGSLDVPQNGELPVYPMTAIDEITYRTPDALFSGQAVVNVIHSCVPSIKNAWHAPVADLNSILVAIRIASYGHELEIETTCPACKHIESFALDLRNALDQLTMPDFSATVTYGDLEIYFHPMSYEKQNEINLEQFENQRMMRNISMDTVLTEDEKLQKLAEVMKILTQLTMRALKYSISAIRTPQSVVSESEHIDEFLQNCDRQIFVAVRDHAVELRNRTELKPVHLTCSECNHEHDQALNLDLTNFFEAAS
jgi:hypothetical protein